MATLMFCTLDFPVSNVQDFDDMSRFPFFSSSRASFQKILALIHYYLKASHTSSLRPHTLEMSQVFCSTKFTCFTSTKVQTLTQTVQVLAGARQSD